MNLRRLAYSLALAAPLAAAAQTSGTSGTRGPLILLLPSGARSLALGNTGVASRDDEVIFFNPAQLAIANGFSVSGEYLSNSAGTGALSAVTRFNGNGGIGFGVKLANYEVPTGVAPATRFSMMDAGDGPGTSAEASVGYAQVLKGFRVGVAAKYAEDVTPTARVSRPLADVGIAKDMLRSTFGLAVQNIGRDMDLGVRTVDLPLRTTLGFAQGRPLGEFDVAVTGALSMIRAETVYPSGGIEVGYAWLSGYNFVVRGGARRTAIGEEPFTAGAGLTMDRLTIDYALETLSNQRVGHRIGVRIR
jgi:hypothetical protein